MSFWNELPQIVIVILLSLGSGTGGYINDVRKGQKKASFLDLTADLFLATTAGLLALYFGQWRAWEDPLIYLIVLIATNNGAEILEVCKTKLISAMNSYAGKGAK